MNDYSLIDANIALDAEVTVRFHLRNLISPGDLEGLNQSLDEYVRSAIVDEGLWGLLDGGVPGPDAQVIEVKKWTS